MFLSYFDELREKLFQHERDIKLEKSLKVKEEYWIKIFKSIFEKKKIPGAVAFKTSFNYQNLDLVVFLISIALVNRVLYYYDDKKNKRTKT